MCTCAVKQISLSLFPSLRFYSRMLTTMTSIIFNLNQALKDMSNQMQARYQRLEHDELQEQLVSAQLDSCAWVRMSFAEIFFNCTSWSTFSLMFLLSMPTHRAPMSRSRTR